MAGGQEQVEEYLRPNRSKLVLPLSVSNMYLPQERIFDPGLPWWPSDSTKRLESGKAILIAERPGGTPVFLVPL